ncbi:unnamed protein product [Calypogeia fissa]
MGQGGPLVDFPLLAAAASHFAAYPGIPSDHATQQFLEQFPLQVLFSALERGSDVPGLESAVTSCLEKIFSNSYGSSLLPYALPYAVVGFSASSPLVRRLTCFAITKLLDSRKADGSAVEILAQSDAVSPLIYAVADGDASVAAAAGNAVAELAKAPNGLELVFMDGGAGAVQLKEMASHESALVRIRALSIAAKIFSLSDAAAAAIEQAGILKSLEDELSNSNDILAQINALELLAEVSETPNGARFLLTGNLIGHLAVTIENPSIDSLVRSRAMIVGARLLSSFHLIASPLTDSDASGIVVAIDKNLQYLKSSDQDSADVNLNEQEVALDALGQIGTSARGAELLLSSSDPVARHVVEAAFRQHGGGIQLGALHALASLCGSERTDMSPLLNESAESSLRNLIYSATGGIASRTPADLLWSLLKQAPEIRVAAYRFIGALVARSWILWEICSHKALVDVLVDPRTESLKEGMEWRHSCCVAFSSALAAGSQRGDQFPTDVVMKLETAARKGPYAGATGGRQAIPEVATQDRF